MSVEAIQPTGAAPREPEDWHSIHWKKVNENVRRLQARIVKATKEGKRGRVKALQHLLTHSFSGKALAVRRVTENQGKNTPGIDKITWNHPRSKWKAWQDLKRRGYQPRPLRRVYILKSNGKMRPLGIPTMKDRAMQALYLLALDPIAETIADRNSYGFRRERSSADAIEQCFTLLSRTNPQWILEGDIKGCFDHLHHEWLLAHVPTDKTLLRKWLKAGYREKTVFHPTEEGTPQGGIISPVLANIALDGLEKRLREKYPTIGPGMTEGRKARVHLVRYADDFLITGRTKELLEHEVQPLVIEFMRERGLELSLEKTTITHIGDGFDFLGQNVRKYDRGKLLIKPSKKNVKTFLDGIRRVIREHQTATAHGLIAVLNPKIRGWANYHRHVVSKGTYARVDASIYQALWQWAKRRHPQKNRHWIANKYFGRTGLRNWRFFGDACDQDGKTTRSWLGLATSTPITRHTKIKGDCNPYDPAWEVYREERLGIQMTSTLRGRRWLSHLWRDQRGICPVCDQRITHLTGWHNHHIVWRVMGGSDGAENRVLVHPNCHRQVHAKGLSVTKPRPSTGVIQA